MRVFISYAKDDKDFALRFGRDLRKAGADIWIDQLDIPPGVPWDSAVEAALKECPVISVILSPRSVASQNVLDEVHFAIGKAKKIVPVMYEACDLPMRLARLQYIDFTALGYEACLEACVAHVKALFGAANTDEPAAPPGSSVGAPSVVRGRSDERLDGKRFLWIDNNPRNNRYERKTLDELGAEVHLALDTDTAITIAAEIPFDFFISDMGRRDRRAGFTLLTKLREMRIDAPYAIYAGANASEYKDEAIRLGAAGCTNSPYELLDIIMNTVGQAQRPAGS